MSEENTVAIPPTPVVVAPPPPPAPPAVTPEHISALHRHLDQIGQALKSGFEAVIAFVRKEAPAVEAGAAAVAAAVPVVGPVAAIVEKAAGTAAAIAASCASLHGTPCKDSTCPNFKAP